MEIKSIRIAAALLLFLSATACTNIDFKEPVSDFGATMAESGAALKTYYTTLNEQERSVYLTRALYSSDQRIGNIDAQSRETPLVETYPAAWVKAKVDTINLLSIYGSRLAALAGSKAPEEFSSGVDILGKNLNTLGTQIKAISGTEQERQFGNDVSAIVSAVGSLYLDKKRDEAIKDALDKGYKPAMKALDFLEEDLPLENRIRTSGAKQSLMLQAGYFNKTFINKQASLAEKRVVIEDIEKSAKRIELLIANRPDELIVAIRKALTAIRDYSNNPKDENSLVRLTAELETFNNRVKPIADAINSMRSL